ncbi:MAG: dihydrolipoyl dehydrogenase family protein [Nocardioidaceae bacterium]
MDFAADVIVIGMGPGGEDAAAKLATAGLDVIAVERSLVGGECPYWGCIPSKMLIRSAALLAEARRIPGMAGASSVEADFGVVATRIREEATDDWDDAVAARRFTDTGGRPVRGGAPITGPGRVEVEGQAYTARRAIVLNTGTRPAVPPIPGLAETPYWTNHEILEAAELPASLAVIGGGAIGLELAQAFSRFGSTVTVVEAGARLLGPEEPEAAELLSDVFEREGIAVRVGASIASVGHDDSGFSIDLGAETVGAEALLVAAGRTPNIDTLGLDSIGVDASGRSVSVDEHQRVTDGVWAIGDITGKGAFTHVSMYQAAIAVASILGQEGPGGDYDALPRVTFTDPEIGAAGLTEKQARDAGLTVRTGHTDLASSSRGYIHKAGNDGFIKVVEDADRGVLVGATSAGPTGGEVMGALAVAIRGEVPVATLRHTIWAYPTFHRAIETALADLS